MRPKKHPRKIEIKRPSIVKKEQNPTKVNRETLPEDIDLRIIDFLESQGRLADLINQFCIEFKLRFPLQDELSFRATSATVAIIFDEVEEVTIH